MTMKKFRSPQTLAIVALALSLFFTACTKEEQAPEDQAKTESTVDEMNIQGQALNGVGISGLISQATAERMSKTFLDQNRSRSGQQSEYVVFNLKDLDKYLGQLKKKYKSENVYVYFGVYDEKTAVNKKDIGRMTVFFLGDNNTAPKSKGGIRVQSIFDTNGDVLDDGSSNYLNHGSIYP